MIKPIETKYKGYRFRSRLEARWAVFFDAINIQYEYEREGFELGEGRRFLPDFYLVDPDCYVEIKPKNLFHIDFDQYINVIVNTALLAQSKSCLLIFGNPYFGEYNIVGVVKGSEACGHFALGSKEKNDLWIKKEEFEVCLNQLKNDDQLPLDKCNKIMDAYKKARQARFEYGENPS